MTSAELQATTLPAASRRRQQALPPDMIEVWVRRQYTSMLVVMSLLVITVHPSFHYILELIPGIPPDSLPIRVFSAGVSLVLLLLVLIYPPIPQLSPWLSIINAGTALATTHLLVLNSGDLPIYLAVSLTTIYGAQLSYIRVREWIITVVGVLAFYVAVSVQRGVFSTIEGWVPPLFYLANYVVASALIGVRARQQDREMRGRIALQRTNEELTQVTEQLQSELVLARSIQQSLLPPPVLAWARRRLLQRAREVGGDFYSYHRSEDGHMGLVVGDVSGKGASAALLMATSLSLVNSHVERHLTPAQLVAELDRSLQPYTQPLGQNCALCYLELTGNTCVIVNAGGVPPYIRHNDGTLEWPDVRGFALGHGIGAQVGYRSKQIAVATGDMSIIVSDGVIEVMNKEGHMLGFDRLEATIQTGPSGDAQEMVDHRRNALARFVGQTEAHDDLTLLVARVHE